MDGKLLARAAVAAAAILAGPGTGAALAAVTVTKVTPAPEGQAVVFTLKSSVPLVGETVAVRTEDGTAKAGEDFEAVSRTVQPVSPDGTDISVPTTQDTAAEPDETFTLVVDPPSGDDVRATGTILNDDAPAIVGGAAPAREGEVVTFTVGLTVPTTKAVTVDVATADGTATAPADFAATATQLAFAPGERVKTFTVATAADSTYESDEAFAVRLTSADANATAPPAPVPVPIVEDDPRPTLTLEGAPPVREGDGTGQPAVTGARLRLSAPAAVPVKLVIATADSGAKAGEDYEPVRKELVFAPGETEKVELVALKGDTVIEKDERFFFLAAGVEHVEVPNGLASAVLEITNDDRDTTAPDLSLGAPSVRGSRLRVRVRCPAGETRCTGRVTFFKDADRRSKDRRLRREVRLGATRFRLDGGRARTVTLKLSKAERALLRRARRPRISAYAITSDAAGNRASTSRTRTLRVR